mgnify:CR=1 FL=1
MIDHSPEHVHALLEKFFTGNNSKSTISSAIAAIERSGYQMEFRSELLE